MIFGRRGKHKKPEKKIVFEYFAPQAEKVELAACFNQWEPAHTPLKMERHGKWKVTVALPPGRYEYRFRVDGNWQNDQRPVECVPNPFGSWNCILEIP
jgi:1,4-alpha-glucan branching enzyme